MGFDPVSDPSFKMVGWVCAWSAMGKRYKVLSIAVTASEIAAATTTVNSPFDTWRNTDYNRQKRHGISSDDKIIFTEYFYSDTLSSVKKNPYKN